MAPFRILKQIKVMKEEIKPALLKSQVRTNVETVINILKYIEVDEETMQYILEKVGMEDHATSMANHLEWKRKC